VANAPEPSVPATSDSASSDAANLDAPRSDGVVLDERKTQILRAIITEYVARAEPVGSRRVLEVARLDVSAATVRNEMAALEEAGMISAPHTSAGRIPTDKGYRLLVDRLRGGDGTDAPELEDQRRAVVSGLIGKAHDRDDLLLRATSALSELTQLVALVITPALDASRLRLVELVALGQSTALLLLVSDTGQVSKRHVDLPVGMTEAQLDRVRVVLGEQVRGRRMGEVKGTVGDLAREAPADLRGAITAIEDAIGDDLTAEAVHQVLVGGSSTLVGERSLDRGQLENVLGLLEERATVGRVLSERSSAPDAHSPSVTIGGEHDVIELTSTSLVGKQYDVGAIGSIGILGPTRMDYARVLSTVRAVAAELERALAALGGTDE
jgi:heat-inducible transcriptional repressor